MGDNKPWQRDKSGIEDKLTSNADKNFVQRLLNPGQYPVLLNDGGGYGTMEMVSGEYDGKGIAYPNIVYVPTSGRLQRMPTVNDAAKYALKSGEYLTFDDPSDAEWFAANNYKQIFQPSDWDVMEQKEKDQRDKLHFSL